MFLEFGWGVQINTLWTQISIFIWPPLGSSITIYFYKFGSCYLIKDSKVIGFITDSGGTTESFIFAKPVSFIITPSLADKLKF